jgi:hypothetical protein
VIPSGRILAKKKSNLVFSAAVIFKMAKPAGLAHAGHENNLGVQRPKITQAPEIRLEGLLIQAKNLFASKRERQNPARKRYSVHQRNKSARR